MWRSRWLAAMMLWVLCSTAQAQGREVYEDVAYGAEEIDAPEALAALLWSHIATCDHIDDDFARRQCQGLRAARHAQIGARIFRMAGDPRALSALGDEPGAGTMTVKLYACLACSIPVTVAGQTLHVVGTGQATVFGDAVLGPVVRSLARPFESEAAAARWKSEVMPRLRTELIFRLPDEIRPWAQGGAQTRGVAVEIIGYRVHDPCTGAVLMSQPPSDPMPREPSTCTGEDLLAIQEAEEQARQAALAARAPEQPERPERLSPQAIQRALAPAAEVAQECFAVYGVAGEARFRITINTRGRVTHIEQSGYFMDTPTGDCIASAISKATFPRARRPTTVDYPFVLR